MAHYRKTTPEAKKLREEGGQWLKSLRNAAEMTQVQVAEKLGYGYYTFIGQIEMGRSRIPPEDWDSWAKLYGVPRKRFAMTMLSFYDPRVYAMLAAPDE